MSETPHFRSDSENTDWSDREGPDDSRVVLAALQRLIEKSRHPVVRACLEQAYDDIVHLTACGEEAQVDDGEPAAAA